MTGEPVALPRVAFVAGTLGRGGAERQLFYQVRALAAAGVAPMVATLTSEEHFEAPIRSLGATIVSLGDVQSPPARVRELVSAIRRFRPHVIQSAHFYTNLYVALAARWLRVAEVGAIRNDTQWSVEELGRAGGASLRAPRHLAVNSRAAIAKAAALGVHSARLSYLPNVVDTARFSPREPGIAAVTLLDVGRLVPQKRHDRFIRLVAELCATSPELRVSAVIVGEGPELADLQRQAQSLGVDRRIRFVVDPPMEQVYRHASILVLTSDYEGTPNVVLEAMSSGLPVVAFDVGGVRDVITDPDAGVLISPGDEATMTDAVVDLARSPAKRQRMGSSARALVQRTRSADTLDERLQTLYRRVLVQRRVGLDRPLVPARTAPDGPV